ncbi:MAG TPA: maleylacetate reductase [Actinophytocola sp.]|uniref:maleylacetate reductase n=1 Tax=Actinophytocola sp. TaxID=1872138 RepID=UPI002DDD236F|nr:maleylacetate reductase [Actinophytocola sp.]HEV2784214.1 maleylacetate reductase [Actinophytocola sp.]
MRAFRYQTLPGRVVFGPGSAHRALVSEVDDLGTRVLLITTKRAEPLATELAMPLGERVVGVFAEVQEHVPQEIAEAARTAVHEARADCMLSIGGGSVVGTAKAVAVEARLPIVAVPTTYSGSEMTPTWGLTVGGRKRTGRSPHARPRSVLYDPELTTTLPPGITAASGMNALAHCVGACYLPDTDPITELLAVEGVRALAAGLSEAVREPDDLDARGDALYGAYLAGTALAAVGPATQHRICHVLGGAYGLPHGPTHAVLLPYVAALVEADRPDALRKVADVLGALRAADGLRELAERIGAPTSLAELGMPADDLDDAARLVAAQVPAAEAVAHELLRVAYDGRWTEWTPG